MNTTDQVLAEILKKGLEMAEKTGTFVMNQAPDVLRQFFLWHTISAIMGCVLGVIILLTGWRVIRLWGQKTEDRWYSNKILGYYYEEEEPTVFAYVIIVGVVAASMIVFFLSLYDLAYILSAPKLYLITHAIGG